MNSPFVFQLDGHLGPSRSCLKSLASAWNKLDFSDFSPGFFYGWSQAQVTWTSTINNSFLFLFLFFSQDCQGLSGSRKGIESEKLCQHYSLQSWRAKGLRKSGISMQVKHGSTPVFVNEVFLDTAITMGSLQMVVETFTPIALLNNCKRPYGFQRLRHLLLVFMEKFGNLYLSTKRRWGWDGECQTWNPLWDRKLWNPD